MRKSTINNFEFDLLRERSIFQFERQLQLGRYNRLRGISQGKGEREMGEELISKALNLI